MSEYEDFLEHYGVKGMKWGKRKTPAQKIAANKRRFNNSATQQAYVRKLDRNVARRDKIIAGKGKALDFLDSRGEYSFSDILTPGVVEAKMRARNSIDRDQAERFRKGKAHIFDKIEAYATVETIDLFIK